MQLAISDNKGADRIINTCSPWNAALPNRVIISENGGQTFKVVTQGLPDYVSYNNCMWGRSYARALTADPKNPKIVYLGMDGDPEPGRKGNGLFKSEDGGYTWKQLPNQPACRLMFVGLQVDPTNARRIFWGGSKQNGGVYRSEDGGDSWKQVFDKETMIWNLMLTPGGTVYCANVNLWRSDDHGSTWRKVSDLKETDHLAIAGMAYDPADEKTLWIARTPWGDFPRGQILKTTDGGATWRDLTGNLPYLGSMILRFNPDTRELWAGGKCLFKIKQ